jgi:hypothetical protein
MNRIGYLGALGVKLALLAIAAILLTIIGVEAALRLLFGFGNPPLYVADDTIGYRLAPNQQVRRFGNRIAINRYSMRGPEITPEPAANTLRVFLLGDSIANGGWWTDQDATLSARLETTLAQLPETQGQTVEVLNASANSWSPRNEVAYLEKYGTFGSWGVVLLINTDDLFGTAPTGIPVGRDRNYPAQKPLLALQEVLARFQKQSPIPELQAIHQEGGDRVGIILDAIRRIHAIVTTADGQLILAMTPLLREVEPPGPRDYEIVARQRLTDFTTAEAIPYLDFLPQFQQVEDPKVLYRDHIHLNGEGYGLITDEITAQIRTCLSGSSDP